MAAAGSGPWRHGRRLFPVGLYATLFAGVCMLIAPPAVRDVEARLRGWQCLPLRVYGNLATDVAAAELHMPSDASAALLHAQARAALRMPDELPPPARNSVVCRVTGFDGGGTSPTVLRLDRPRGALRGAMSFVTHGDALIGFLRDGDDDDVARVDLLERRDSARAPRRVVAAVDVGGRRLRFLVEPALAIEPAPLRCVLPEDPYLAASLRTTGLAVVTDAVNGGDPLAPPAGLSIGTLECFGYPDRDIVVGLYVRPSRDPRALATVVVHGDELTSSTELDDPLAAGERRAIAGLRLPVRRGERWYAAVAGDGVVGERSAVVRGDTIVGLVTSAGPGHALVTPVTQAGWLRTFLLLPDGGAPSRALRGRFVVDDGGVARIATDVGSQPLVDGTLFTGVSTPDCPPGLRIGRVHVDGNGGTTGRLVVPPLVDLHGCAIFVADRSDR
jgi:hypothetical protein